MARVEGLPAFAACKSCHFDTRIGGHQDWQFEADDPYGYATSILSSAGRARYAYTASLMNGVHMSHAMDIGYPQSMASCVTCHEGKLGQITTPASFTLATCRSCHPINGPSNPNDLEAGRAPALKTLMQARTTAHDGFIDDLYADAITAPPACTSCHIGSVARTFAQIHPGYDPRIYAANGARYSDIFKVTVDSAVLDGTTLSVSFSAKEMNGAVVDADTDPASVASIVPFIHVWPYAYDTKDAAADPLSYTFGGVSFPRFRNPTTTSVDAAHVTWTVDVSVNDWAAMLGTSVKRLEVVVLPTLNSADGKTTFTLRAPSQTFTYAPSGALAKVTSAPVADVNRCNACHDALGTTFHSGAFGGNLVACRTCHNVRSGGSRLEMQSRSLDSYVHAIHRSQAFDILRVDFGNAVKAMRYQRHIESTFPNFTLRNCRACHHDGTFNPPANDQSLPGVLSASANVAVRGSWTSGAAALSPVASSIGEVPSVVTGPASRACGSCHRAARIKENDGAGLAALDDHADAMGYMVPAGPGVLDAVIEQVMSAFR
jgi:OmcA/MtrC family decaheme c-type cytochrome